MLGAVRLLFLHFRLDFLAEFLCVFTIRMFRTKTCQPKFFRSIYKLQGFMKFPLR